MKILLIGNGGRENAIAWKIFNSDSFKEGQGTMFCTIGSPGINEFAEPVDIAPSEIEKLVEFAESKGIDFTVVGPEIPLSLGIVDKFDERGLLIFGPGREAAMIETSKIFAKKLMLENNIPTAAYRSFSKLNIEEANNFLNDCKYPVVIKADGLAAGKGVIIANDIKEAKETVSVFAEDEVFGEAGFNFVVEEFLSGEEVSVFAITDGTDYVVLPFSQDHKKVFEGDTGKNTGGMGAIAPVKKFMSEELMTKIKERIIEPVLKSMRESGVMFKGCLYCGLIVCDNEPSVIEFNCRFGDPETQAVLPLIGSDFLQLLLASSENRIGTYDLEVNDSYSCCVVMASGGYPDKFETGKEILIKEDSEAGSYVFHSGTKFSQDKKVISNGGRVMSVVGVSEESLEKAALNAYERVSEINFENAYYRRDIGKKQMKS